MMQTIVAPEIEKDKALMSAVEAGNRFFQAIRSEFWDEVNIDWHSPVTANDDSLTVTLRYRPNAEVTAAIPLSAFHDPREMKWRLGKIWDDLLTEIGLYHHARFLEKLAAFEKEELVDAQANAQ